MTTLIKKLKIIFILLASIIAASCDSSDPDLTNISGLFKPGAAYQNVKLAAYDSEGNSIDNISQSIDSQGVFTLSVPKYLEKIRIVASSDLSTPYSGNITLSTDIVKINDAWPSAYINIATTLISKINDYNGLFTPNESATKFINFFNLPPSTNVGYEISGNLQNKFNQLAFIKKAMTFGGVNSLISQVASDINSGQSNKYAFNTISVKGVGADFIGGLATSLGKGVIGSIGGDLAGYALVSIFGDSSIFGTGNEARQQELLNQFAAQRDLTISLYSGLSNQIVSVKSSIDQMQDKLVALGESINNHLYINDYNDSVRAMYQSIANIDALFDRYQTLMNVQSISDFDPISVDLLVRQIANTIPTNLETINLGLTNASGADGEIKTVHLAVGALNSNGSNGLPASSGDASKNYYPYLVNHIFFDAINDNFDYYKAKQLKGLTLLIEADNYFKNKNLANSDYVRYTEKIQQQSLLLYSGRIPQNVMVSPYAGLMWHKMSLSKLNGYDSPIWFGGSGSNISPTNLDGYFKAAEGYRDWRMPTGSEYLYLGLGNSFDDITKMRKNRTRDQLVANGFLLQNSSANDGTDTYIASDLTLGKYFSLNTSTGQVLPYTLDNYYPVNNNGGYVDSLIVRNFPMDQYSPIKIVSGVYLN